MSNTFDIDTVGDAINSFWTRKIKITNNMPGFIFFLPYKWFFTKEENIVNKIIDRVDPVLLTVELTKQEIKILRLMK